MDRTSTWTVRRWDWHQQEQISNGQLLRIQHVILVFCSTTMIKALWTVALPISGCLKRCSRLQLRQLKLPLRLVLTLHSFPFLSFVFHSLIWLNSRNNWCQYKKRHDIPLLHFTIGKGRLNVLPNPLFFADWTVSLWILAGGTAGMLAGWHYSLAHFPSHLPVPDEWKPQSVL